MFQCFVFLFFPASISWRFLVGTRSCRVHEMRGFIWWIHHFWIPSSMIFHPAIRREDICNWIPHIFSLCWWRTRRLFLHRCNLDLRKVKKEIKKLKTRSSCNRCFHVRYKYVYIYRYVETCSNCRCILTYIFRQKVRHRSKLEPRRSCFSAWILVNVDYLNSREVRQNLNCVASVRCIFPSMCCFWQKKLQ